jgi:choline kinase
VQLARGLQGRYDALGEWAGCLKLSAAGAKQLRGIVEDEIARGERQNGYEFIIPKLFETTSISYEPADGVKWLEIDFPHDIERAGALGIATLTKLL